LYASAAKRPFGVNDENQRPLDPLLLQGTAGTEGSLLSRNVRARKQHVLQELSNGGDENFGEVADVDMAEAGSSAVKDGKGLFICPNDMA
jgi:hypothetical protein